MRIMLNVAKDINLSVDDIMIPIGIIHFNALCFIYYLYVLGLFGMNGK